MKTKNVSLVHVPYEHRGGEDLHVEILKTAYEEIGLEVNLFPQNRGFQKKLLKNSIQSLLPSYSFLENQEWKDFFNDSDFLHIHNIFPTLGPNFLNWCIQNKKKVWMTVHNHRFFCTNGLALREEKICMDCMPDFSFLRPLQYNCNQDLKKTLYHTVARDRIHRDQLYLKAIEKFIAPSPYIAGVLNKLGIPEDKITLLINPVLKIEKKEKPVFEKTFDVFFAGRLSSEKGIKTLLQVVSEAPDLQFVICGDGPLRAQVQAAAEQNTNLHYLGQQTSAQVAKLIELCKTTVLPSICNEILPTFVLESYIRGRSCVLSRLESTLWLGEPEFPGFFAEPGNATSFLFTLRQVLSGSNDLKSLPDYSNRLGFKRYTDELKALVFQKSRG